MKLRNFAIGVLLSALASTAILHACEFTLPTKSGSGTLQSNSRASLSAKTSDDGKQKSVNQSGKSPEKESDAGDGRSTISPKQPAIDRLLETGACPGCDLKEVNLEGLNLEGVNLEGANLEGANLAFTRLENAILKRANLKRANLEGAALGCNIHLNLPRNGNSRGFSLHTYNRNGSGNSNLDINVTVSRQGTGLDLYAEGDTKACIELHGADLKEARLPDGSTYP